MKAVLQSGSVLVSRGDGPKVRKESTFWHALRETLNAQRAPGSPPSTRWRRVRPANGGYGLTSMPFALWRDGSARDRRQPMMIGDGDYAIRCPAAAYDSGETIRLTIY